MTAPANITEPADYARAVALVQEHNKASTSYLQRQMRVAYNAAAKMIEQMESDGIVSAPDHVGRRTVLSADAPASVPLLAEEQLSIPVDMPEAKRPPDDRLRLLIERVERLAEERKGISDDIRDVYAEAKAVGYDVPIMRQIVRLRKMKPDDRREMEAIRDTYLCGLGME